MDVVDVNSLPDAVVVAATPTAPPAKRRRTTDIIATIAQTTAIATLGAVAAWSALAFS
ncbi:hypothetical protein K474DRAFT_1664885 [Panus rudis PR-1116 ss-1]|nr:hypothetical protein K474DRAFT_1664885 [Panus rudis PR-1116 ss-1]